MAAHAANAAKGRLMKKIHRQLMAVVRYPPTTGPIAVITPPRPDQAPIAAERSSGWKVVSMIARLPGVSRAAPIPWSALATISAGALGAMPQTRDAPAN